MSFTITLRATSIIIEPGSEAQEALTPLFNLLTYEDEYEETVHSLGYMYDEENDRIFFHRGVDVNYLRRLLPNSKVVSEPFTPFDEMKFDYEEIYPPKNEDQADVINFIAGTNQHASNADCSQLFLVKEPGFGKAEPYSRKIPSPTEYGYTYMGDLNVGDHIFDQNGLETSVKAIYEQGIIDVYKITFGDGREAYCADDHLWEVYDSTQHRKRVMMTSELRTEMLMKKKFMVEVCKPVHFPVVPLGLSITPYHMGIHIAQHELTFIPHSYMYNSIEVRRSILRGIMDVSKSFDHYSEDTFQQIQQLIWSLGEYTFYQHPLPNGGTETRITKIRVNEIKSIVYDRKERCRCITVDNWDHLYLTENYVVTHNTFCSSTAACILGHKTLIIMHRDSLRSQWSSTLKKMIGMSDKTDYHEIASTEELEMIAKGEYVPDYDIYLMTHATFRAGLRRINDINLAMKIGENLKIGLKIIDEAHLEFKDIILIDFLFNVKRNLYLTATDGRSAKDENSIFKMVFSACEYYKKKYVEKDDSKPSKWVDYVAIEVNTHVQPAIDRYRIAGGRGMNPASYGKWCIARDKNHTHIKCIIELIRQIYTEDEQAKVIVFMPLIDLCEETAYQIKMTLNNDEKFGLSLNVKTINSHNSAHENERNKRADVIVTTIGSCGTGTDIPGMTDIICCSPFKSSITAKQVAGRLRYYGKICHYYDIYDASVQMDKIFWKLRFKTFKNIMRKTSQLIWTDDPTE